MGEGIETLHAQVVADVLRSAYRMANEDSGDWYRASGFEEGPDLHLARIRR